MFNAHLSTAQKTHKGSSETTGITEIILPHNKGISLVMPTLAHLSHKTQDRWFTWLPPRGVTKALLQDYQFDLSKIRLLHPHDEDEMLWLLREALAAGNSQTVVASPGRLSDKQLTQLELAAASGDSTGLLIRYR